MATDDAEFEELFGSSRPSSRARSPPPRSQPPKSTTQHRSPPLPPSIHSRSRVTIPRPIQSPRSDRVEPPLESDHFRVHFVYGPEAEEDGAPYATIEHVVSRFYIDFHINDTDWDLNEQLTLLGFDLQRDVFSYLRSNFPADSNRLLILNPLLQPRKRHYWDDNPDHTEPPFPIQLPGYTQMPRSRKTPAREIQDIREHIARLKEEYDQRVAHYRRKIDTVAAAAGRSAMLTEKPRLSWMHAERQPVVRKGSRIDTSSLLTRSPNVRSRTDQDSDFDF